MIIRKTFLRCDSCRKTVELPNDFTGCGFGGAAARDAGFGDWVDAGGGHHLCPTCAVPYLHKKADMERELKRLAGFDTIEVDL